MADTKISALTELTTPAAGDWLPIVDTSAVATKKVDWSAVSRLSTLVEDKGAIGDGVTDDTTAIQNALNASSVVVFDSTKTYKINSNISVPSNTKVIGSDGQPIEFTGAGNIQIQGTAGASENITANAADASITVVVADGSTFSADDIIEVQASPDVDDNTALSFNFAELAEIESISVNTLTLKKPLAHDYYIHNPYTKAVSGITNITGVTLQHASIDAAAGGGTLSFTNSSTTITWAENGDSAGAAVDISSNGDYQIFSNNGEFLNIAVVSASLPGTDQSDTITVSLGTFATPPKVTKITPKENIVLDNIYLNGTGDIDLDYAQDVTIKAQFSHPNVFLANSATRLTLDLDLNHTISPGSGSNALLYLFNLSHFRVDGLRVVGGNLDHARFFGCSNGIIHDPCFVEGTQRTMYCYWCTNLTINNPKVYGSRSSTSNIEILLYKNCHNVKTYNIHVDERNKRGGVSGVDIIEISQHTENTVIDGGYCRVYDCNPISVKSHSTSWAVKNIHWDVMAHTVGTLHFVLLTTSVTTPVNPNAEWEISGNKVFDKSDGDVSAMTLIRCNTSDKLAGYDLKSLKLFNNMIAEAGSSGGISLPGLSTGRQILLLEAHNNHFYNGAGSGFLHSVAGIMVDTLKIHHEYCDVTTLKINTSTVTNVICEYNNIPLNLYTISNETTKQITEYRKTIEEFTVAGVPTASENDNAIIIVSDEAGGRTIATSDGTNWRRVSDGAIIS